MARIEKDRLTRVSEFRSVIDALARGGIIGSGSYERLRRELLQDQELADLPKWLRPTRTVDEFKDLLYNEGGDRIKFVKDSMEPRCHISKHSSSPRNPIPKGRSCHHGRR